MRRQFGPDFATKNSDAESDVRTSEILQGGLDYPIHDYRSATYYHSFSSPERRTLPSMLPISALPEILLY